MESSQSSPGKADALGQMGSPVWPVPWLQEDSAASTVSDGQGERKACDEGSRMPLLSSWDTPGPYICLCFFYFGQKSLWAPRSHFYVTSLDVFQPFSNLTMVCVPSRLSFEPTGAGIWGIKSLPEDYHLVQR